MQMKKIILVTSLVLASSIVQANDYTPAVDAKAAQVFSEACASCHGDWGTGKFGFLLKLTETTLSKEEIKNRISAGGTIMPKFPNIKKEQLSQLTDYVKALSPQ
jgi:mono/diheme cytochrome c family protein